MDSEVKRLTHCLLYSLLSACGVLSLGGSGLGGEEINPLSPVRPLLSACGVLCLGGSGFRGEEINPLSPVRPLLSACGVLSLGGSGLGGEATIGTQGELQGVDRRGSGRRRQRQERQEAGIGQWRQTQD